MARARVDQILTINTGSSSLKAGLFRRQTDGTLAPVIAAAIERIGHAGSELRIQDAHGQVLAAWQRDLPDHQAAIAALLDWLKRGGDAASLVGVGHRVVHGGPDHVEPQLVTEGLLADLRALIPIDPKHLPQAIAAIVAVAEAFPHAPQVACFDTAFHHQKPAVARIYPLPYRLAEEGVHRYGFHGLSYESIMDQLRGLGGGAAAGRIVIAHLGNGSSMAAVRDGRGLDTTMGFTPTGGLMMGTRCGDLDPGVLLYLLQVRGMRPQQVNDLVNQEAGLLGVSGVSSDMRDLLAREATDPRTADAVALFCYQARKYLGAMSAVLGGLETLVFTGGIGEHAAPVRARICAGMEFAGIGLDPDLNRRHAAVISRDGARVMVRVMRTDEDLMIARHTLRLLAKQGATRVPL